ncbi:MAG: serine/threonine protein kinase with repeat [Verrucomicrobiales bacterium]|nr:serine/threonine protein kinase with repeat [Verrucomicrobiales bacterium]
MAEAYNGKMNGAPDADIVVFTEALSLPPEDRGHYLDQACKGDVEFRLRVEALLRAYEQADDFLGRPAAERPPKAAQVLAVAEKPGDRIGHYKLLQQIGEGGWGVVYMAEQEEPVRRRVALKIIKPGMDTKNVIARFEAERQALALMNHPNIAKVFDAGATEAGRPYFVMELVRGVKITEYCNGHALTTEDRLKLFVQVCQAVQHAHQRGIIHRDIKPSNILVTQSLEGIAMPMVIDFGVAKATTDQRLTDKTVFTAFEMLIGTPAYMSPEQAALSSVDVDTRTDIYSLGVLLYELLTSSTPFETGELLKAGLDEIRRVIREQEPPRPSTRLSKMPGADLTTVAQQRRSDPPRLIHLIRGDLDWIVMKALEKDRTRRYETANDLALDVKRYLENEPVSARPPSKLYKFQKTVRRNRLLFIGIGVIATLLVVSLIVVSASLAHERQSQHEAKQVKQFLEDMLKGLDPNFVNGRDTAIVREILDKAAARVGKELTNQPGAEAELRSVIGTAYERTGQYPQAEEMQRAALELYRKRFGRESPEAAASLNDLGLALIANGKMREAEQVNREALGIRRRRFGDENADVATSKDNLAHACNDNGKFTEAEALEREALATRQRMFGNESQEVTDSLRNLIIILGDTGKWAEAEATAREVLALRRKLLGPRHPSIAGALYDLAWAAAGNGKQREAEALKQEGFTLRQKVSDNHADVAISLCYLGNRMRERGNLEDAHSVLSAALSLQRKFLGDDHPDTLHTLKSLGLTYQGQTNWSDAETVFREELALRRKRSGNDDPQTLYALRNLAGVLEGQGKWTEAETLHREAFVSWRKRSGNNDPQALWEVESLAKVLIRQKKFGETERLLEEMLTPAVVSQRASSDLLFQQVELMGRQGRWQAATATATLIVQFQPTDHYPYHTLAALLATTRNRPAYEILCRKIFSTFTNTTNPYICERIAKDCLFLPDSGVDLELVDKLVDKAVSLGSDWSDAPYFQVAKAMSTYRLGRFAEAIKWAEKTLKGTIIYPKAHAYAILAMAHWNLGQKDVARLMLDNGNSLTPRISPSHQAVDLGESWTAWLLARISLDEAAELIGR